MLIEINAYGLQDWDNPGRNTRFGLRISHSDGITRGKTRDVAAYISTKKRAISPVTASKSK